MLSAQQKPAANGGNNLKFRTHRNGNGSATPFPENIALTVGEYAKFLSVFLRRPALTSAVMPSSRWLAARMIDGVGLERAKVVVELGAGTGAFTRVIQQKIRPGALFLALEINPVFARHLTERFPRAHVINESAEWLDEHLDRFGRTQADSVLSGLPWAGFTDEIQQRLLAAVLRVLRPGGYFATFAYSHTAWMPGGQRFRRLLKSSFPEVTASPMVLRNFPPAFVYRCRK